MDAAAAEASGFANRVQAGNRLAVSGAQDAALQISLDSAEALAGKDELADGDQRARFGREDRLEVAGADAVAAIAAEVGDAAQLIVIVKGRAARDHLALPSDCGFHLRPIEPQVVQILRVHALHQLGQRIGDDNVVRTFTDEPVYQLFVAEENALQ